MIVGSLRVSLHLYSCHSLKEKRRPRRMLLDRARNRFGVAAAEVDDQDTWNLLTLGFAAVGPDKAQVEKVLRQVLDLVAESGEGAVAAETLEFTQIDRPRSLMGRG